MSDSQSFSCKLEGGLRGLPALMAVVASSLQKLEVPPALVSKYEIATEEIILNTLKHGSGEERGASVEVDGAVEGGWVRMLIRDNAIPFNPLTDTPKPQLDAALEEREIGGLGVFLVFQMMDEVSYELVDGDWNQLSMACKLS